MENLASYFSGGGVIIAILWFVFKGYIDKRNYESGELKKVTLENSVTDSVQDVKINSLEKRVDKIEDKIWKI